MRLFTGGAACCLALASAAVAAAAPVTKTATTKTYALTLSVGPAEAMYTPAEVKAKHPASGEVMTGSSVSMNATGGHASSMEGALQRHVEVHVKVRATGKVSSDATPRITLTDESSSDMMSTPLQVMVMTGIGEGMSDVHYGNNVALVKGHEYGVVVTVKGERARFSFRGT